MAERSATVLSVVGLHARPAALFAQAAATAPVVVTVTSADGRSVNAASILGILTLGVNYNDVVTLSAEGEGAEVALDELVALLESDLDKQ